MKLIKIFASVVLAVFLAFQMGYATGQTQDNSGGYVTDASLTTKVKAALLAEPELKSLEIHVETVKGTVHLSGRVGSEAAIQKAVEVARNVKGVKMVKNELRLK